VSHVGAGEYVEGTAAEPVLRAEGVAPVGGEVAGADVGGGGGGGG
jgi:hypothetical protein